MGCEEFEEEKVKFLKYESSKLTIKNSFSNF